MTSYHPHEECPSEALQMEVQTILLEFGTSPITVLEFSQIIPVGECPACKRYLLHLLKLTPSITVRGSTWAQSLTPGLPWTGPAQLYGAALLRAPCYRGAQCE